VIFGGQNSHGLELLVFSMRVRLLSFHIKTGIANPFSLSVTLDSFDGILQSMLRRWIPSLSIALKLTLIVTSNTQETHAL